jgi:hypothetical protein
LWRLRYGRLASNNPRRRPPTITDDSIALHELLEKNADADLSRAMMGFGAEAADGA